MFYFITSLRHPKNAKNYQTVIDLLELTIESVCAQITEQPFRFLIVCNEIPDIEVDTNIVEYLQVDYPPPGAGQASELKLIDMQRDKGAKLAAGLLYMEANQPSSVFIIDADDWISSSIVAHVSQHPEVPFWYANSGYLVNLADKQYIRKYGLCRYCGTSFIYNYSKLIELLNFSTKPAVDAPMEEIVASLGEFELLNILGNHRYQFGFLHEHGLTIKALPFKSICWILNTGENHSGKTGSSKGLPMSSGKLQSFGITSVVPATDASTISSRFSELNASLQSYVGWVLTDKKAHKV